VAREKMAAEDQEELTSLDRINASLVSGWEAKLTREGRIYYIK